MNVEKNEHKTYNLSPSMTSPLSFLPKTGQQRPKTAAGNSILKMQYGAASIQYSNENVFREPGAKSSSPKPSQSKPYQEVTKIQPLKTHRTRR